MGTVKRWTNAFCFVLNLMLASGNSQLQPAGPGPDSRCPCLSLAACPTAFAASNDDVQHFGNLPACTDTVLMRCCGARDEVRETISVNFQNATTNIVNGSFPMIADGTGDLSTFAQIEIANNQSKSTFEEVIFVQSHESRSLLQPDMNITAEYPVNVAPCNQPVLTLRSGNETGVVTTHNLASLTRNDPEDLNMTVQPTSVMHGHSRPPEAPSSQSDDFEREIIQNREIKIKLNSAGLIDIELHNASVDMAQKIQELYIMETTAVVIDQAADNSKIETETTQVSLSNGRRTEISSSDNETSILAESPSSRSAAGNSGEMSQSMQVDKVDNSNDSVSALKYVSKSNESNGSQSANSTQLDGRVEEERLRDETTSLIGGDSNDTISSREAENEASMQRLKQTPGIVYVFPLHNMRYRKEKQTPFVVYPTNNATNNRSVEKVEKFVVAEIRNLDGVNSDLEFMASSAKGVSSTVSGKVIIRKFMPKVRNVNSGGNMEPIKTSTTPSPSAMNIEQRGKSNNSSNANLKSNAASGKSPDNSGTSPSIKYKQNLKYKINTRRLPPKFAIKTRENGSNGSDQEIRSSLLTQSSAANRNISQNDDEIDTNGPIRRKSIVMKHKPLKSRLQVSGSEHREDVLLPEGGEVNRHAIPSREKAVDQAEVTHPSRAPAARPAPRRQRPVAVAITTEVVEETERAKTPATQRIRSRNSHARLRPSKAEQAEGNGLTTTVVPKMLGSYLVNVRIKPIFSGAENAEARNDTSAPVALKLMSEEDLLEVPESQLQSLKLKDSPSSVISTKAKSDVTTSASGTPLNTLLPHLHDQNGNIISTDLQSPQLETRQASSHENSEIVEEKHDASPFEQSAPTKERVIYSSTPASNPTLRSGIRIAPRSHKKRKVVDNKSSVTPKVSFPIRGSVRFGRPTTLFDENGNREAAQESKVVDVLKTSDDADETVAESCGNQTLSAEDVVDKAKIIQNKEVAQASKVVDISKSGGAVNETFTKTNENKTMLAEEVKTMKIVLPVDHDSAIPIQIMLSNTEQDGVIEITLPKMDPNNPMQLARSTRGEKNTFHPPKRVQRGFIPSAFFSIVGPIPKGFTDPSVINRDNQQTPTLELPKPENYKKFREPPMAHFLTPVIDVEEMRRQHYLFLLRQYNSKRKS